ncbi:hypothetical protein [Paracoccus versutus]|uniref:hypothetical protein n=1 Tax=Paracoccus versutus TaxID=34007 RepID=UPI000DF7B70F|nr:hypothetical protein [Paracoccus versutus]RDD72905.1 hypothetical protein DVR11_02980 [Paracoccus versutus]
MAVAYVALENVVDVAQLREVLENHGPVLLRAVNDAGRFAHNEARKRITDGGTNWPAGYINNKTLNFRPATSLMRGNTGSAVITARSRPSTLTRFNATVVNDDKRKGVRVEVNRGRPKILWKAFMTNMGGNALVMMREGDYRQLPNINAHKYAWNGLVSLYGPSVDQVFKTHRDGPDGIATMALDRLEDVFAELMGFKHA